jgi:alpha-mannosidase
LRTLAVDAHSGSGKAGGLMEVDDGGIVVEAVKLAEDGEDIIARLYESRRRKTSAVLRVGFDVHDVQEVDLMEEGGRPLPLAGNQISLEFEPFEIKTLRLSRTMSPGAAH